MSSLQARWDRFQSDDDHFVKIARLKYRFVWYFGEKAKKPFQIFEKLHKKFTDDITLLIQIANQDEGPGQAAEDIAEMSRTILFQGDSDQFQHELGQARDQVFEICRKYLK